MQVRPRGVAAITAILFVLGGFLAMRHEAATPHVRTEQGAFVHGRELSTAHASRDSDIHGQRNPDADSGDCSILAAFHQAASDRVAAPVVTSAAPVVRVAEARSRGVIATQAALYRLAPKTSPPLV